MKELIDTEGFVFTMAIIGLVIVMGFFTTCTMHSLDNDKDLAIAKIQKAPASCVPAKE